MNVTLTDPVAAAAAPQERHADADARHLRWRAELERAQWQARQRYTPARAAASASAAEPPAAAPGGGAAGSGRALPPDAVASAVRTARAAAQRAAPRAHAVLAVATAPGEAGMAQPSATLSGAAPAAAWCAGTPAGGVRSPAAHAAAAPALRFELPDWPAQSAQVCVEGRRVSVVLRDAQLAADERPALRERLAAQCRACGLELAELLINGVPVEPAARVE